MKLISKRIKAGTININLFYIRTWGYGLTNFEFVIDFFI